MKVKIILFTACWSLLTLLPVQAQAEKVAVFEDFGQPESIYFGNGFIYVQEKTTIFVYNPKDYQLVSKFGKEGEGPGEIKKNPFPPHRSHSVPARSASSATIQGSDADRS